jgi:hypothetical protein
MKAADATVHRSMKDEADHERRPIEAFVAAPKQAEQDKRPGASPNAPSA